MTKKKTYYAPANTTVFSTSEIGKIIRTRRKELGYTQEYIASIMGVSPRLIGEIERGSGSVGIEKVLNLLNGLGIDVNLVVRGK